MGYNRKRSLLSGKLEGGIVSVGLLVGGLVVVVLVVWALFSLVGKLPI